RHSARDLVVVASRLRPLAGRPGFGGARRSAFGAKAADMEEELRRLQHRFDDDARAVEKAAGCGGLRVEQRRVPVALRFVQRPAKRALAESSYELIAALCVPSAGRFTWHKAVDVAGPERVERQLFRGRAVG